MAGELTDHDQTDTPPSLSGEPATAPRPSAGVTHDLVNYLAVADGHLSLLLIDASPKQPMPSRKASRWHGVSCASTVWEDAMCTTCASVTSSLV